MRGDGATTSITQAFREDRLLRMRIASAQEGRQWQMNQRRS